MKVTAVNSMAELKELQPQWDDLSSNAIEPNVFYDSWMLIPAMEFLHAEGVTLALVWSREGSASQSELAGLFPLKRISGYHGMPFPYFALWRHQHCFLGTPLIRKGMEQECLRAFFGWLDQCRPRGCLLELGYVSGDGPFYGELSRLAASQGRLMDETVCTERRILRPECRFDEHIRAAMPHKRYKQFLRKMENLKQLGEVRFHELTDQSELKPWVTEFLNLEMSGWKGASGSAMSLDPRQRQFFETITGSAFQRGKLSLSKLSVDGKPAAMRTAYASADWLFAFKIAYDEAYGKYSPGVLLALENTRQFLDENPRGGVDSCADAGHPVFTQIWRTNRTLRSFNVSLRSGISPQIVRGVALLRNTYRRFRRKATGKALTAENAESAERKQ